MKDEFNKMLNHIITEEESIDQFNKLIENHPDTAASRFLTTLLECQDRWFPSITKKYICGNRTTNCVEGFFGTLEKLTEHQILLLGKLVYAVFVKAENLFILSRNQKQLTLPDCC